ncbi:MULTISPECIES: fimbrial protein [Providencia]|uniref:fimbrial protein n=1 Tax=Providencia TaxID=586 RepID=UPI0008398B41|nr:MULTISPECIES: type 1 fimbrial protein [Providencia]MBP6120835.1 type 1 fimbrial protein [Providencia sp.]NIH23294.1 type 1 fimbrial protein [Providencia heimbachae]
MTFKKIALTTTLLVSLSAMSLNASAAASQDVTLQGIITNTTCDVTVNGGKSVLNVGVFKSAAFTAVNQKVGSVDMPVTLTNCPTDVESGDLIIQGLTSVKNNDKNIFVSNDTDTVGFMIALSDDTTLVKNGEGPVVAVAKDKTEASYNFKVGMASTTVTPVAGSYSAPILVAYVVE